ncbi:MAG: radical SAM protein [Candidatus Lokiarchaeota archaeon]|nr:radical SAM protein [Candidatus Lokiarchaeota archaeon]MBD3200718.1 radical SAM protein [Candidatus Lokiarchaeota archaeon]
MTNLKYPNSVTLELTQKCNLRCRMCYFWGETGLYIQKKQQKSKPKEMSLDLIKTIINEFSSTKVLYSLFGGEPFLHSEIDEIIRLIKKSGGVIDTPTNGTMLKKHATMLVETGFDALRVSLDGPEDINDQQRGKGSFKRALEGIRSVYKLREKKGSKTPRLSLIFTITPINYQSLEKLFLEELNLESIDWVTLQMQNYITEEMAEEYVSFLKNEFNIQSDVYCSSLIRDPSEFDDIDIEELVRQINTITMKFDDLGINYLLEPPTFSKQNLNAYFNADWRNMEDQYRTCSAPWKALDITVDGDIAPCHIYYDLKMGNLYEKSFNEIWNGEKYRRFRTYMKEHKFMSICPGCCILYLMGKKKYNKST